MRFSQLNEQAQEFAAKEYLEGWLETHPEERNELDIQFGYEGCRDTEDEIQYTKLGKVI